MDNNPLVALLANSEFVSGLAGIFTTVSLIPQVRKVLRERNTTAISLGMYIVFSVGIALWLYYGILVHSLSVMVTEAATLALALTILGTKLHLEYGWFRRAP
jgi:MtN3 and saliva related transmembrane protein